MFTMNEKTKDILEWTYCIVIAVVLAILVRYFIGTPTIVQQPSMYPTLKEGQRLILNRWGRTIGKMPERGNIITFEAPSKDYISAIDADLENPKAIYKEKANVVSKFVHNVLEIGKISNKKRVIALPGEHIKIENGNVYINGEKLEEYYLQEDVVTDSLGGAFTDLVVPEGYVFAMGDNRSHSRDCRSFGCIPLEKIESKVLIRFWPLNLFGKVE